MEPQEYDRVYRHETSHFWYRGLHARVLRAVERSVRGDRAPRVLDAGCGTGGLLARIATRFPGARGFGADFADRALVLARSRSTPRLVRAGVESLPFADGSFDVVTSLDVLYHRAVQDDLHAVREFARVLRPGGALILNLPAHPSLAGSHDRMIHGARRYRRSDVARLARAAGLEIARLSWFNSFLFPPIALLRLVRRNAPAESDVGDVPRPLNAALAALLALEARVADVLPLPFGLSVFAVLRKPTSD